MPGRAEIKTSTAMPDFIRGFVDPSTALLLAEHARLAALFQHNQAVGEQLVTMYLTIVSIAVALLVGLGQLGASPSALFPMELAVLLIVILVGAIAFQRLVERKIRGIEYLRAINRIHRHFVDRDPLVGQYLYWPPHDDLPPLKATGTTLGGLRDLVAGLNSIFLAFVAAIVAGTWVSGRQLGVAIAVGLSTGAIVWLAQRGFNQRALVRAEQDLLRQSRFRHDN
jgi:hypothetical protein